MHKRTTLDTPIFHRIYSLYKHVDFLSVSVPKTKKYSLWQRVEDSILSIMTGIIEAGHCTGKTQHEILLQMSVHVDLLKVLIRLSRETGCIDLKRYLDIEKQLQEIGRMLGGWIKFAGPQYAEDLK